MDDLLDVQIMAWGLVYLTVCAPVGTDTAVLMDEANRQHPTGILSSWRVSTDRTFATGQPNPCPCERIEGREHTLMEC